MDPLISAAANALSAGDPLRALNCIALRDDAPALALRGIAMAQLGDFERAKSLLKRAVRAFPARAKIERARCIVAEAEIALASRDLAWPASALAAARETLVEKGDRVNAAHAHYLEIRRQLLIGRLDRAERLLTACEPSRLPAALRAMHELIAAGIEIRRLRAKRARASLVKAERHAREAGIPALGAEVEAAFKLLEMPAARLIESGNERSLHLGEVEALQSTEALVVDGSRLVVRDRRTMLSLASRPVLFTLVRALAEAWPSEATRETLIAKAFSGKEADESHRARLRVEIGRLRAKIAKLATVKAAKSGFALSPRRAREVIVLALPIETREPELLALLSDGEVWSTSALAIAIGKGQRTVQRALEQLAVQGKVHSIGRGRARRWLTAPLPGITTILLLPAPVLGD